MAATILTPEDNLTIRPMSPDDAKRAAELSGELGYPTTTEKMHARLSELASLEHHIIYAACVPGEVAGWVVAGWIDVGIVHHLQSPSYGEIGGLVVASDYRARGIGRKLVEAAEQWVAAKGITTILVRSQVAREAAHRFYLQQNFSRIKTSAVFTKSL